MPNTQKEIPPVDVEKLLFCFYIGAAASDMRDPTFRFEPTPIVLEDDVITLTDNPLNRFTFAISEQCETPEEFHAIAFRIFALMRLVPEAPPTMVRENNGRTEIHNAAFRLAATFPLLKGEWFDAKAFYAAQKQEAGK